MDRGFKSLNTLSSYLLIYNCLRRTIIEFVNELILCIFLVEFSRFTRFGFSPIPDKFSVFNACNSIIRSQPDNIVFINSYSKYIIAGQSVFDPVGG